MSEKGIAGMHGGDVRSDCRAQVERVGDTPAVQINSKVQTLYGEAIRTQAQATLAALGADALALTLDDSGALPFTIAARIEAAVKRLDPRITRDVLPELNPAAHYPIARSRARGSRLYLPGNTPKFFINAGLYGADAVILDLEDAVSPAEKDAARILVRNALRAVNFYGAEKMVRINALPAGLDDVRAIAPHGAHTLLLPKVESPDEVTAVDRLLTQMRADDAVHGDIWLIPIVESARGVHNAFAIAAVSPNVVALTIGLEDYTADIGAQRTAEGRESFWARGQIVNAARAAGVQPLGSVFANVEDMDGFHAFAAEARQMGFAGVGCLHPRQVRAAHEAFKPSIAEIEKARRIIAVFEAEDGGVVSLDGQMVDAPVVERARQVLRMAASQ